MKGFGLLVSISLLSLLGVGPVMSRVVAQSVVPSSTITLYSNIKPRGDRLNSCAVFQPRSRGTATKLCDLRYGSLYAGEDHDWFDTLGKSRSVVRDLGQLNWADKFTVPVVAALPELKPGETRTVTVDTSGADGAAGGEPQHIPDIREDPNWTYRSNRPSTAGSRPPKNDGKPKIDPVFTKAVPGHLYVIHVVDELSDFYALFRVESLEKGDRCTLSWRLIPAPAAE